jgi:pyruvate kinase
VHEPDHPQDWNAYVRDWLRSHGVEGNLVVLTEGPSWKHPEANNRMELIDLTRRPGK